MGTGETIAFEMTITECCARCKGLMTTDEGLKVCWENRSEFFGKAISDPKTGYCKQFRDKFFSTKRNRKWESRRKENEQLHSASKQDGNA